MLLACNLTGTPEAPTVVPRATSTPPPTIGYSTLAPNELPAGVTQVAPIPVPPDLTIVNLMNQVDVDRLFVHIDTLVNMRSRRVNSPGIESAATYVQNQFNAIREGSFQNSFSVLTQEFPINFDGTQSTGKNVIGVLAGTDVGGGVIILGAHYDSISYNFNDSAAFAPGANDNASGIAALLEVARIMSQRRHRATIMFVAFSAEEIQRLGSIAFVEDYLRPNNVDVAAMINMDIIGSSTGPDGAVNDRELRLYSAGLNESRSRQLARALNLIAQYHALEMRLIVQDAADREGRYSDHMSFSDAGYPAVRFIEALEDPNRQHSDRDTIDDIQAEYLHGGTQTILAVMTALADGPPPPRNISLRPADGGQRTLVWEGVPGAAGYIVALRRPDGLIYSDYFPISDINVTWDGFVAANYISLAIASVDQDGLIGQLSSEFGIAP
ncbi:MAG: M20/M25/M40 family metallo-hydrolase [Anaerolineae bacterium]|nr:M20/M25/M40 family metallo-hydrolase [Anaerolineae bacterium]